MNCKRRNISGGNPKKKMLKGYFRDFPRKLVKNFLPSFFYPNFSGFQPSIIDSTPDAFNPALPHAPHLPGSAYRKRKNGAPPTTDNQHGTAPRRRRLGILMNFSRDFLRLRYYPHLASGGGAGVVPSVGG